MTMFLFTLARIALIFLGAYGFYASGFNLWFALIPATLLITTGPLVNSMSDR